MTKEELITRIKKLLALSDSSNPNESCHCPVQSSKAHATVPH